jgi:glycosyltransferase involved in cell wall biosynthesis
VKGPRVAYVLKMYPRFSETFILSELLELERQGAELHVFSLKRPNDGIAHADVSRVRAPVTYLPQSLGGLLWAQRCSPGRLVPMLVRALRKGRFASAKHVLQAGAISTQLVRGGFEHLHAHFASGPTSVALHASRLTGIPFSFTAHAKDIFLGTVRPEDLERKLGAARFAVTVSDFNVRYLTPLANGTPIVRVYNGLDLARFAPRHTDPEQPPLILAVGRLIEKKGFDDLIRACATLARSGVDFRCEIVGKGPLEAELRLLSTSLGVADLVRLVGPVPREQLIQLLPRAAVFAAPCVVGADGNRDGLPTVLIEAMAIGVPVVATPVTGIPELIEDGATGLLAPERDPRSLAHSIDRLLANEPLARQLAAVARRRVEENFDVRRNVALLRQLFVEAVA